MKLRTIFILINFVWIAIIFILCILPGEKIPNPHWNIPHLDKVVHFGMYFIQSLLLAFPLEKFSRLRIRQICIVTALVALLYGGTIEILQARFFHRSGDLWDLAANLSGGIAGVICYPWLKRLLPLKNRILP